MIAYHCQTPIFVSLFDMATQAHQESQEDIYVNMVHGRWTLNKIDASAYPYRVACHFLASPGSHFVVLRHEDFVELYGRH